MSTVGSGVAPSKASGAMYRGEPMVRAEVRASRVPKSALAVPKSNTFTAPETDTMMLLGLMSRWTTRSGSMSPGGAVL